MEGIFMRVLITGIEPVHLGPGRLLCEFTYPEGIAIEINLNRNEGFDSVKI
jgi:hypothetical protein